MLYELYGASIVPPRTVIRISIILADQSPGYQLFACTASVQSKEHRRLWILIIVMTSAVCRANKKDRKAYTAYSTLAKHGRRSY